MKKTIIALTGALVFALGMPAISHADDVAVSVPGSGLVLSKAWVRAVPDVSTDTAAYVTIQNTGKAADALLSVKSPAAAVAAVHRMTMNGDVMHMEKLKELKIPAGKTVGMDPDSIHIMLEQLKAPLKVGDSIDLTLHFRKAGDVTIKATVTNDPS